MPADPTSILDSTKKVLGLDFTDTSFDLDVTMHINTVLAILLQIGVGPDNGFFISDNSAKWTDLVTDLPLRMVQSYIAMKVRLMFDPPASSAALISMEKIADEFEWRLLSASELINPPSDPFGSTTPASPIPESGIMRGFFAPKSVQLSFQSVVTPDASQGNVFYLTMGDDCTINAPVNPTDAEFITLVVTSNGHDVTWGSGWNFGDAGAPTLSVGGKADIISGLYRAATTEWDAGSASGF